MSLKVLYEYYQLERKVLRMSKRMHRKQLLLEEANNLLKMTKQRKRCLREEKVGLEKTLKFLQDTVEEHKGLLEENKKLKAEFQDMKEKNENMLKLKEEKFHCLMKQLNNEEGRHNAELLSVKQQCSRDLEHTRRDLILSSSTKEQLLDNLMKEKNEEVRELKNKLKIQEAETHSKIFNLEMEYRGKIARFQEASRQSPRNLQQEKRQPSVPCLIPHNVYKRKLDILQEEKEREIKALREKINKLEKRHHSSST